MYGKDYRRAIAPVSTEVTPEQWAKAQQENERTDQRARQSYKVNSIDTDAPLPTFTKSGKIRVDVMKQIKSLFSPADLSRDVEGATLEKRIENTFNYERTVKSAVSDEDMRSAAEANGITPEQMLNAFKIARGEPIQDPTDNQSVRATIDLTEDFKHVNAKTPDEIAKEIEDELNRLIGQAIDTATKPLQVQVTDENIPHIVKSNVRLKGGQKKRHDSALLKLEKIINNSELVKESDVDLTHNTNPETIRHKQGLDKYVLFSTNATINDTLYNILLTTEKPKGYTGNTYNLYNVQVKENPAAPSGTLQGSNKNITTEPTEVKQEIFNQNIREQQSLAEEMARLDDIYPAYTGETINIDGTERTVYNSNGDRIAQSAEALQNFWRWFGDSKVVDSQGRPLVVYHGSDAIFNTFDNTVNQTKERQIGADEGYFFTDSEKVANRFRTKAQQRQENDYYVKNRVMESVEEARYDKDGNIIGYVHYAKAKPVPYKNFGLYKVYLKAENVVEYSGESLGVGEERAAALRSAKASGKDGMIIRKADTGAGIADEYIVFNEINTQTNQAYENFIYIHSYMGLVEQAPDRFTGTKDDARNVLGNGKIKTPIETITVQEQHLDHLFNDNEQERRGFLKYAIATMERPNLIVKHGNKNHYLKLFMVTDGVKAHLQIVKVANDGSFYVTNYRPTKSQVSKSIKEGQILYDLSNIHDSDKSEPDIRDYTANKYKVNQIKSTDNRGTFSADTGNIYYQSKLSNIFKPLAQDIKTFGEFLQKAIRGELKVKTMLPVSSKIPAVYKNLGFSEKPLNLPQTVLKKINVGKHQVPLSVIEQLPELISDPVMILDSKTDKNSLVAVLDAVDENGDVIVAVIKQTDNAFHVIPSVYGKEQINGLINSSKIRYIDTERPTNTAAVSRLYLPKWNRIDRSYGSTILHKNDLVKQEQQTADKNLGAWNPQAGTIELFSGANETTLAHELSHFWLDNMMLWSKMSDKVQGKGFTKVWGDIKKYLSIDDRQDTVTQAQAEKYTSAYMQYIRDNKVSQPLDIKTLY